MRFADIDFVFGKPAHEKPAAHAVPDEYGVLVDRELFEYRSPFVVVRGVGLGEFGGFSFYAVGNQLALEPGKPVVIGWRWIFRVEIFFF